MPYTCHMKDHLKSVTDYDRMKPIAALRGIVESLWVQDASAGQIESQSSVLPTGTVEILFHYGDRFVHIEGDARHSVPRSYITGQRTRSVTPVSTGCTGIVIASLYPWALGRLFGGAAPDLTDGYTDLKLLLPVDTVTKMEDQLQEVTRQQRIESLQCFLLALLQDAPANPRVETAVRLLASAPWLPHIDRLAHRLGLSERHFRRLFTSEVGISPKLFHRIMRFQRTMQYRTAELPWSRVAAVCGYADQAHLIREVVEFSGRTPRQVPSAGSAVDEVFNGAEVSDFFNTIYL